MPAEFEGEIVQPTVERLRAIMKKLKASQRQNVEQAAMIADLQKTVAEQKALLKEVAEKNRVLRRDLIQKRRSIRSETTVDQTQGAREGPVADDSAGIAPISEGEI
jgi:hypothetical protein